MAASLFSMYGMILIMIQFNFRKFAFMSIWTLAPKINVETKLLSQTVTVVQSFGWPLKMLTWWCNRLKLEWVDHYGMTICMDLDILRFKIYLCGVNFEKKKLSNELSNLTSLYDPSVHAHATVVSLTQYCHCVT